MCSDPRYQILAVSTAISKLPRTLGASDTLDWIPVDILAIIMLEYCTITVRHSQLPVTKLFNILNPAKGSWESLLPDIQSFKAFSTAKVVSWEEWLETLKGASSLHSDDPAILSGIKLLPFLESLGKKSLKMTTANAEASSKTLAKVPPVSSEWIRIWMRQWGY